MNELLIYGLVLGLTSNLHCIGMCGPIALAIPVNRTNNWTILVGVLSYNFGRILTYATLGAFIGAIGFSIELVGIMQWISIIAGIGMILYAWRKWLTLKIPFSIGVAGLNGFISKNKGKIMASDSVFKLVILGLLNGLLPCGMVYIALMNALLGGNPLNSSLAMAFFGLGTLPALVFVGFYGNQISIALRQRISKFVPYLLTLVGLLMLLRGLNLNIPMISPAVKVKKAIEQSKPSVEVKCCYKPAK